MSTSIKEGTTVFSEGDIVWAKVRNYPFWPARIEAISDKTAIVKFYGTGQTGKVKVQNELRDYRDSKDELCGKKAGSSFKDSIKEADDAVKDKPVKHFLPVEEVAVKRTNNKRPRTLLAPKRDGDNKKTNTKKEKEKKKDKVVEDREEVEGAKPATTNGNSKK